MYLNFTSASGLDVQLFNGIAALALILLALYIAIAALARLRVERGRGMMSQEPAS
jgi:hypothetical protein